MGAVLDCTQNETTTYTECKLECFRGRQFYRHRLTPKLEAKGCASTASCKERLNAMKASLQALAEGKATKSVNIDGKAYSNHPADLECLKDLIYELECECGQYARKKKAGCGCSGPCGCNQIQDVCGCGCGCGGGSCYGSGMTGGWML